jgi:DNA-3-methyladenine glycosylase
METLEKRLKREFFEKDTVLVARELLGKKLYFEGKTGIITETEAYKDTDPACHAYRGKTKRTQVMFGKAGFTYVYFIYGMYHCLNIVTENEGKGCAVLIRAIEPVERIGKNIKCDGPGKLCRCLGITKEHNKIDICNSESFKILDYPAITRSVKTGPRIGIKKGKDLKWRFLLD